METTNKPATLFRYWLCHTVTDATIRIEWVVQGIARSTYGRYFSDDHEVNWQYGDPPERLQPAALECAADAGEYTGITGCLYEGNETVAEMDRQCAARCQSCGIVQDSEDDLSSGGDCSKCFVGNAAKPSFRILRERRTSAGIALVPVEHPIQPGAFMSLHAANEEAAVVQAKGMGATGRLVAIAEAS